MQLFSQATNPLTKNWRQYNCYINIFTGRHSKIWLHRLLWEHGTWDLRPQSHSGLWGESSMPPSPTDALHSEEKDRPGTVRSVLYLPGPCHLVYSFPHAIIRTLKCFVKYPTFVAQTTYVEAKMSLSFLSFSKSLTWWLYCSKNGIVDGREKGNKNKIKRLW